MKLLKIEHDSDENKDFEPSQTREYEDSVDFADRLQNELGFPIAVSNRGDANAEKMHATSWKSHYAVPMLTAVQDHFEDLGWSDGPRHSVSYFEYRILS